MSASIPTMYCEELLEEGASSHSRIVGVSGVAMGLGISSESEPVPTRVAADDFFDGNSKLNASLQYSGLFCQARLEVSLEIRSP